MSEIYNAKKIKYDCICFLKHRTKKGKIQNILIIKIASTSISEVDNIDLKINSKYNEMKKIIIEDIKEMVENRYMHNEHFKPEAEKVIKDLDESINNFEKRKKEYS